jgi:hypothetical protein
LVKPLNLLLNLISVLAEAELACSLGGQSGNLFGTCRLNLSAGHGVQGFASGSDAMQAEERTLLKAIAAGDAKSLERLFARAQTRVFRYLMRVVKSQAIAEELLNEVFLTVWQNAHRYEGRSEPLTWILAIAHNKAMSALRRIGIETMRFISRLLQSASRIGLGCLLHGV